MSGAGSIGTGFLSLPTSASELSLGQNPVFGLTNWTNPAIGANQNSQSYLNVSYGSWLSGVRSFKLSVGSNLGSYKSGYRIRHVSLNDLEYRTDRPTDEPLASFGASGTAIDFHLNKSWEKLNAGIALRWIYMDMYTENSQGISLDMGGIFSIGKKLKIAVSLLNLGTMNAFKSDNPTLPTRILAGISTQLTPGLMSIEISASGEYNSHVSGIISGLAGQMRVGKLIINSAVRSSDNVITLSGGVGLSLGMYSLNYGLLYGTHQLGLPQMIDLSIRLP